MRLLLLSLIITFSNVMANELKLHPDFPVVEGSYRMTDEWVINLDQPHNRRFEDNSLVIWRPGFTLWINIWNNDNNDTIDTRFNWFKDRTSDNAFDEVTTESKSTVTYTYRLVEDDVHVMYGLVFSERGHVQIAAYFDVENDYKTAKRLIDEIEYTTP